MNKVKIYGITPTLTLPWGIGILNVNDFHILRGITIVTIAINSYYYFFR